MMVADRKDAVEETTSTSSVDVHRGHHSRAIEIRKVTPMVVMLVVLTSFCGFMFGYDTGYISGALVAVGNDLGKPLTPGNKEFITSATSLGAFLAALSGGTLADAVGRKWVISGANILFIVGGIVQTCAHTLWTMIAGRFVMGFGVGFASLVAPIYISEMAPSRFRGRLIVLNVSAITFGQFLAYCIGAGLEKVDNGWRIMVGLSLVPAVVQMFLFVLMPETPRYLVRHGRYDDARKVINKVYSHATDLELDEKLQELIKYARIELYEGMRWHQRAIKNLRDLHCVPSNFRALVITCGLQGIQQFSGWNSLMYFSATVFQAVGFNDPIAVSIVISGTNFVFTIVAFFIIDVVGRRRLLLSTMWGMSLGLVLNAIAFHFLPPLFDSASPAKRNAWSVIVIIGMLIFAAFFATGLGNVPWQQSEMFSMNVRGVGASFATATNWAGSLVVAATFLTMLENITPTGTFAFYAGLCALGEVFVYFLYPEMAGLSIEEVQELLTGGFNVKASVRRHNEIKKYYADAIAEKRGEVTIEEHV